MRAGCSQEVDTVAEWMEGEKLGAVTGRKRRDGEGGGPLKREEGVRWFLHPQHHRLPQHPPPPPPVMEGRRRERSVRGSPK